MASLNSHGTITEANLAERIHECTKYKAERLRLSRIVHRALSELGVEHFIEGGTLVGAYRDGKMLAWDDDFDFGVYANLAARHDLLNDCAEYLHRLCECLREWFAAQELREVECRVVLSYARKVEVYLPARGGYPFRDTDYHNVSCDLTLFTPHPDLPEHLRLHHSQLLNVPLTRESVLPLSSIVYEGERYPAPNCPHDYLTQVYGYLGSDAIYDTETGKYKKRD